MEEQCSVKLRRLKGGVRPLELRVQGLFVFLFSLFSFFLPGCSTSVFLSSIAARLLLKFLIKIFLSRLWLVRGIVCHGSRKEVQQCHRGVEERRVKENSWREAERHGRA